MIFLQETYLSCEDDDSHWTIIPGIIESTNKLLDGVRSESISSIRSIDCYLREERKRYDVNQIYRIPASKFLTLSIQVTSSSW